jgi:flagellar basal-body rod modification protein FlgD
MSDISGVTSGTSTTASTKSSSVKTDPMGKDAFFKMLVAQLRNQDPLNPMDGSAFAAQLAQFSSLEQLTNLNSALTAQNQNFANLLNAQSVNLIGKEVTANRTDASTFGTTTITGEVTAVQFKDGAIYLTVNDEQISFGDVTAVK